MRIGDRGLMIKKLTLLIAMLIATSAWAEWTMIVQSEDEEKKWYLDIESIKSNKDYRYAWILMDLLIPYNGMTSSKTYYEVHCEVPEWLKTKAFIAYEARMGEGDIQARLTPEEDQAIQYPAPNSINEEIVSTICHLPSSD